MSSIYMAMNRKSDAPADESLDVEEIEVCDRVRGPLVSQRSMTSLRKPSLTPDDSIESNIRITTPRVTERKRLPPGEEPGNDQERPPRSNTSSSPAGERQSNKPMSSSRTVSTIDTSSLGDPLSPRFDQYCDKEHPTQGGKDEVLDYSQLRRSSRCYESYSSNNIDPSPLPPNSPFPNSPTKTHRQTRYSTEILRQTEHSETTAGSIDDDGHIHPGAVAVKARRGGTATTAAAANRTIPPPLVRETGPPVVYDSARDPSLLLVSARIVADRERDSVMELSEIGSNDIEAPPDLRRTTTRSTDEIRQEILSETVQATEVKTVKRWMYHRKTWLLIAVAILTIVLIFVIQCKTAAVY